MKKNNNFKLMVFLLISMVVFSSCGDKEKEPRVDCADELFYYVSGEKRFLDDRFLNDWLFVGFESQIQNVEIVNFINQTGLFKSVDTSRIIFARSADDYHMMFLNTKEPHTCSRLKEIISDLEKSSIVAYATLSFRGMSCFGFSCADLMAFTHFFIVAVIDEDDLLDLYAVAEETNTWIKGQDQFRSDWFILRANKHSKGNAMQMMQYFEETGKFVWTSPNFIEAFKDR